MSKPLLSAAVGAAFLIACACGGTANAGTSSASPSPSSGRGGGPRGASGQLVQINPTTLILTGPNGDITVTYSDSTTFDQTSIGSAADIVAGVCVLASGAKDAAGAVTATTVRVSPGTSTGCGTGGFGPGGPNATPRPGATPRPTPSGFANMGFVAGVVKTVSGSSITVTAADSTTTTFTLAASAVITKTSTVTTAALQTGECISATGARDASGNVVATAIVISPPTASGTCTARFFRGGRGGGGGGGGGFPGGGGAPPGAGG